MASTMKVLNMHQDSDQPILNFIAQLKAAARQCNFKVHCKCTPKCKCMDFTVLIVQYMIGVGVSDTDLQEELLTEADAIAKESAKYSQAVMSGDGISHFRST